MSFKKSIAKWDPKKLLPIQGRRGWTRVVIYLRRSTQKQDTSIGQQVEKIAEWCKDRKCYVVGIYVDDGVAGWDYKRRLDFHRLENEVLDLGAKHCVVYHQNRFSRLTNTEFFNIVTNLRLKSDCTLWPINRQRWINTDKIDECIEILAENTAAHNYCQSLSQFSRDGMQSRMARGEWLWPLPFGADKCPKTNKLIAGKHASLVEKMFKMILQGHSVASLCRFLNESGVPSPNQGKEIKSPKTPDNPQDGKRRLTVPGWCSGTVNRILRKSLYVGDYTGNSRPSMAFRKEDDKPEAIFIPNNHYQFVNRKTFDKVQEKLDRRRDSKSRNTPLKDGGDIVLSGKLVCSHCGHLLSPQRNRGNIYYICNKEQDGGCEGTRVNQDAILTILTKGLSDRFGDPEFREDFINRYLEVVRQETSDVNPDDLKKQLKSAETKKKKASQMWLDAKLEGDLDPEELDFLKSRRDAAVQLVESLKRKIKNQAPEDETETAIREDLAEALEYYNRFPEMYHTGDLTCLREMIDETITEIIIITKRPKESRPKRHQSAKGQKRERRHHQLDRCHLKLRDEKLLRMGPLAQQLLTCVFDRSVATGGMLTYVDAAEHYGLGVQTIREYVKRGKLKSIRFDGTCYVNADGVQKPNTF